MLILKIAAVVYAVSSLSIVTFLCAVFNDQKKRGVR